MTAFRVLRVCAVEQVGVEVVDDFDSFLSKELAVLAHDDALSTLRSDARCWFRSGGTYSSRVCPLPANVRRSQHVGTPSELRYALERGEAVVGLDAEIHRGLVVLHGWKSAMDSLAPDQEREATLRGDGAELALREYGVRRLQEDVLELARPWLIAIVEDSDAPHLICFEGLAHWFVALPVGGLALLRLWMRDSGIPGCQ